MLQRRTRQPCSKPDIKRMDTLGARGVCHELWRLGCSQINYDWRHSPNNSDSSIPAAQWLNLQYQSLHRPHPPPVYPETTVQLRDTSYSWINGGRWSPETLLLVHTRPVRDPWSFDATQFKSHQPNTMAYLASYPKYIYSSATQCVACRQGQCLTE